MNFTFSLPAEVNLFHLLIVAISSLIMISPTIYIVYQQNKELKSLKFNQKQKFLFDAIFLNIEDTKAAIIKLIKTTDNKSNVLKIDHFGLDFETIVPMFTYAFQRNITARKIRYRGLIIDPKSENIKKICGGVWV